ncbi:MAG: hypothetical protein HUJ26_19860 [Planctomycetaceae bacterium]|nr:hypothetical protein [Planctomycetaceae bacterium]
MMLQAKFCPDCQTEMQSGVIPDLAHGVTATTKWLPGTPPFDTTFWGNLKDRDGRLHHSTSLPVITWRCPDCGLLRSYAHES